MKLNLKSRSLVALVIFQVLNSQSWLVAAISNRTLGTWRNLLLEVQEVTRRCLGCLPPVTGSAHWAQVQGQAPWGDSDRVMVTRPTTQLLLRLLPSPLRESFHGIPTSCHEAGFIITTQPILCVTKGGSGILSLLLKIIQSLSNIWTQTSFNLIL